MKLPSPSTLLSIFPPNSHIVARDDTLFGYTYYLHSGCDPSLSLHIEILEFRHDVTRDGVCFPVSNAGSILISGDRKNCFFTLFSGQNCQGTTVAKYSDQLDGEEGYFDKCHSLLFG